MNNWPTIAKWFYDVCNASPGKMQGGEYGVADPCDTWPEHLISMLDQSVYGATVTLPIAGRTSDYYIYEKDVMIRENKEFGSTIIEVTSHDALIVGENAVGTGDWLLLCNATQFAGLFVVYDDLRRTDFSVRSMHAMGETALAYRARN